MSDHVLDVDRAGFQEEVVERSYEQPVVVDFWASWCGPCLTLGPVLEEAVEAREGAVRLAKVDVDANGALAGEFRVRGIPAVMGFRDGEVVARFTGAKGREAIDQFLDQLAPSEADRAAARGDELAETDPEGAEEAYRRALELEPDHRDAGLGLARLRLEEDPEEARELVHPHRPDPDAEAVAARADLALAGVDDLERLREVVGGRPGDGRARVLLGRALAAEGRHREAVDHLLTAVELGGEARETAREQLVSLFTALGDDHALVRESRPRLARALY